MNNKTGFSSRIGFVLAAAGSAVGLGNLWRFPYLAAKYGGGIFLLVYIILAVTFGFALMITEIAIGRKTGKSPIEAYKTIDKRFGFLGILASLVPIIIFPYYCVIGGWIVKFFAVYLTRQGHAAVDPTYFGNFIGGIGEPLICLAIFLFLTSLVVWMGVEKGIERVSKILMPLLLIITIVTTIYSLTIDGAMAGLVYYLKPDFEAFSMRTVVAAMGQLFYSMSLAMGIMITYGSYMRRSDNLEASVRNIEVFDTVIAILSGMMIVPAVYAFSNGDPSAMQAGPTLMFVTLPKVFDSMYGGEIFGFVFFALVLFAALTSAISLMETIVSVFSDKLKIGRRWICAGVMVLAFIIAIPSSLGNGVWSNILILGRPFLDFFDFISNNIMMPIVALGTVVLVGYIAKPKTVIDEVKLSGKFNGEKLYVVVLKYIAPICLVAILISSIIGYV